MTRNKPTRKIAKLNPGAVERIAAASLENPALGARRLSAVLAGSSDPSTAVDILNDQTLVFYRKEGIAVQAVEAGNGLVSVTEGDPEYADFLKRHGITLTSPAAGDNPINGFIEWFARLVRKDFLTRAGGPMTFQDLEAIQFAFSEWVEPDLGKTQARQPKGRLPQGRRSESRPFRSRSQWR